jgi:hypothetical protein
MLVEMMRVAIVSRIQAITIGFCFSNTSRLLQMIVQSIRAKRVDFGIQFVFVHFDKSFERL